MKKNSSILVSILVGLVAFFASATDIFAQVNNRNFIKEQIAKQEECRNVAITKTNGDLMLYGKNGWAAYGCPESLTETLDELTEKGEYIDDVQLTEEGRWLILYGNNGFRWNDIPAGLEEKLREWNDKEEVITSVSFNDAGEWVAVSTNYISASDNKIRDFVSDGMNKYGGVWTTCMTDDALVVVYEKGFRTIGEIPSTLDESLNSTSIDVYRLKIAGDSWFFSDGKSLFEYHM